MNNKRKRDREIFLKAMLYTACVIALWIIGFFAAGFLFKGF